MLAERKSSPSRRSGSTLVGLWRGTLHIASTGAARTFHQQREWLPALYISGMVSRTYGRGRPLNAPPSSLSLRTCSDAHI
jgi:hypothetical protein